MPEEYDVSALISDMDEANAVMGVEEESETERAYQFLRNLAAAGKEVPETLYKIYASGVGISRETLYAVTSYFEGAGVINIICDCSNPDDAFCEKPSHFHNQAYTNGLDHLRTENVGYSEILAQIEKVKDLYR